MKAAIYVILTLIAVAIAFLISDDLNRARLLGSEGYIESGSKFGIEIDMDRGIALKKLASRGFEKVSQLSDRRCDNRSHPTDQQIDELFNSGWGSGVICLESRSGKVTAIGWSIGGWQL